MARPTVPRSAAVAAVVLAVLLVVGASGGAVAAGVPDGAPSAASTTGPSAADASVAAAQDADGDTIALDHRLQLTPQQPGEITVTSRFDIPSRVVGLETFVPPEATVVSTTGFEHRSANEYRWDGRSATPSVTYRLPANRTMTATGPIAGTGDYLFVDAGRWALVAVPQTPTRWRWTGDPPVRLSRETTVDGPGAVGGSIAFLGEHEEVTRTAHGQTFRLVVPEAADLAEPPERILDSLADAADALRVGDRDGSVFAVAAPTGDVRWAVRGFQAGDADLWVRDAERLDTADNVWLHEYVHTRQGYVAAAETRWFTEASASYYAALLAFEQERIGFDAFRDRLAAGARPPDRSAVLAERATWDTVAPYTKGALVAGDLDHRLRTASDRRRSLQDVFAGMNAHDGRVTADDFCGLVGDHGDDAVVAAAERYTTTSDVPSTWNRAAHEAAFGATPAAIEYAPADGGEPGAYHVSGPYRNGSVGGDWPIQLVTGETLALDVVVTNAGGSVGEYDARLLVDGSIAAREQGGLAAGESRTVTLAHRFDAAGEYTVTVGEPLEVVAVAVRPPAVPTVTDLTATRTDPLKDGRTSVAVTAGVRNDHDRPAVADLALTRNGTPVETRRVVLAAGERRTVEFAGVTVGPGVHVFGVGGATATVAIEPPTTEPALRVEGDGFGFAAAAFALLALANLLARRR